MRVISEATLCAKITAVDFSDNAFGEKVGRGGCLLHGLTLVHFSAQFKRILWHRGAFRGCV